MPNIELHCTEGTVVVGVHTAQETCRVCHDHREIRIEGSRHGVSFHQDGFHIEKDTLLSVSQALIQFEQQRHGCVRFCDVSEALRFTLQNVDRTGHVVFRIACDLNDELLKDTDRIIITFELDSEHVTHDLTRLIAAFQSV